LEKKIKSGIPKGKQNTIVAAISALQNVVAEDFKATEIEVGVVSAETPGDKKGTFEILTEAEVEAVLTAISEQD
jgi:20S proteasome subunit alpha 1